MKMLFSRGDFSYDGKNTHSGLICFCHFNTSDTADTINLAVKQIERRRIKKRKKLELENVILVPFSNLDEEIFTMGFDSASLLFKKLNQSVSKPIIVPFVPVNEFHWNLPINAYTKFISI